MCDIIIIVGFFRQEGGECFDNFNLIRSFCYGKYSRLLYLQVDWQEVARQIPIKNFPELQLWEVFALSALT